MEPIPKPSLDGILSFLETCEHLKTTYRSAWTSAGRSESVAEHTWRLGLMVLLFESWFPELDTTKLFKMCMIHDLGEIISGDIPAIEQDPDVQKSIQEREDLLAVLSPLPRKLHESILALWDEYEAGNSPEAKVAKALDKLETIMQHNQGANPPDFNYEFNLGYGRHYTDMLDFTRQVRVVLDEITKARENEKTNARK